MDNKTKQSVAAALVKAARELEREYAVNAFWKNAKLRAANALSEAKSVVKAADVEMPKRSGHFKPSHHVLLPGGLIHVVSKTKSGRQLVHQLIREEDHEVLASMRTYKKDLGGDLGEQYEIQHVAVNPKYKRQGYGHLLYLTVIAQQGSLISHVYRSPQADKVWKSLDDCPGVNCSFLREYQRWYAESEDVDDIYYKNFPDDEEEEEVEASTGSGLGASKLLLQAAKQLEGPAVRRVIDIAKRAKSYQDFLSKTDGENVLYRAHHGAGLEDNVFMTDYIGHARTYADNEEDIDGIVFNFSDVLRISDAVFDQIRRDYGKLPESKIKKLYVGHPKLLPDSNDIKYIKRKLMSEEPYSDLVHNIELNDFLIPIFQDYAIKNNKNVVSFLGTDYHDFGGQNEFVVKDISRYPTLRSIWTSVNGNEKSAAAELEDVVTVELLCCMTPDGDEEAEQRTEETKQMYDNAALLLKEHGARLDVSEHYDFGEQTAFADAYARIPTSKLIEVLDTFDEHGIVYDNIDLPEGAPQDLVAALNKRYPARSGVMVNASAVADRHSKAEEQRRWLVNRGCISWATIPEFRLRASPALRLTLWRAAEDDYISDSASFAETREAAEAYLDTPGFGGPNLYRTDVTIVDYLDLTGDDAMDVLATALGVHPDDVDYGAIGIDELIPRIAGRLEDAGVQWVRVPESHPTGTYTWIYVGGPFGDEPELTQVSDGTSVDADTSEKITRTRVSTSGG